MQLLAWVICLLYSAEPTSFSCLKRYAASYTATVRKSQYPDILASQMCSIHTRSMMAQCTTLESTRYHPTICLRTNTDIDTYRCTFPSVFLKSCHTPRREMKRSQGVVSFFISATFQKTFSLSKRCFWKFWKISIDTEKRTVS